MGQRRVRCSLNIRHGEQKDCWDTGVPKNCAVTIGRLWNLEKDSTLKWVIKEQDIACYENVWNFCFDLPQELIAQDPLEDRSSSRLLVLDKNTGEMEHRHFRDITVVIYRPGDCLVINNTKVIPARLFGVKEGHPEPIIEVLLLKRRENDIWETLVKPGKKCEARVQ